MDTIRDALKLIELLSWGHLNLRLQCSGQISLSYPWQGPSLIITIGS